MNGRVYQLLPMGWGWGEEEQRMEATYPKSIGIGLCDAELSEDCGGSRDDEEECGVEHGECAW